MKVLMLGWEYPPHITGGLGTACQGLTQALASNHVEILLKNYRLSDDIAFRFSNRQWSEFPLTADKYAGWIHQQGETVNLFMDYETFGEHQWEETGIFNFLEYLPSAVLSRSEWKFSTPGQIIVENQASTPKACRANELSFHRLTSWADMERDLTAWRGNRMQARALQFIYDARLDRSSDALEVWRRLQTSDHFYYMSTKWFSDGDVHQYFSPYTTNVEILFA